MIFFSSKYGEKMIRNMLLISSLFISLSAKAESSSTATYLNLPFGNVVIVGDMDCDLNFHDVSVSSTLMNVTVDLDNVEITLVNSDESEIVTTLDVLDAKSDLLFDWLSATKVIIKVRSKEDLNTWNKFLNKEKQERNRRRKLILQPRRVLPPKN